MTSHNTTYKKWNSYRLLFNGKRIYLKKNPRKGKCMKCGTKGNTNIHHEYYNQDNPLDGIVELCPSCHGYASIKLKQIDPVKCVEAMALKNKRGNLEVVNNK